jgi:hypothetical protein
MSDVTAVLRSFASIVQLRNSDSMDTVGALVSSFVLHRRCLRPSAQPLPLIRPLLFCFKNIEQLSDLDFSSRVSMFAFFGSATPMSCSCFISDNAASLPASPKTFLNLF